MPVTMAVDFISDGPHPLSAGSRGATAVNLHPRRTGGHDEVMTELETPGEDEPDADWDGTTYRGDSWMRTIEYFYTRETVPNPRYEIGAYTYGTPAVYDWEQGSTLKIGRYTSIADEVTILLGGDHRIDWVSTYPFATL